MVARRTVRRRKKRRWRGSRSLGKETIGTGANESVVKAVENAVLGTIEGMKTNFNCKDYAEIFIDPDDCEEE